MWWKSVCSRRGNSTPRGRDRPWSTLALVRSPCKFGLVQCVKFVASLFVPPYFLRIFLFGHRTHPLLFPLQQGLNLVWPKRFRVPIVCWNTVYHIVGARPGVGAADVLPRLMESVDHSKLRSVQFLYTIRVTFVDQPSYNRPCVGEWLPFCEQTIRVTAVEQQSRLVYVGNLPGEVPDATKSAFLLSPFGDSFWWFPRVLLQGLALSR